MGSYGLAKEERIRRSEDFRRIIREGTRLQTPHFRVFIQPNQLPHPRLGITVSKRIGAAVRRNRVKRLVREFFRLHKVRLPSSSDLVFVAREGASSLNYRRLEEELDGLLRPGRPMERC